MVMDNTIKIVYGADWSGNADGHVLVDRQSGQIVTPQEEIPQALRGITSFNPQTFPQDKDEIMIDYVGFWYSGYASPND
jgi:hypothetical protein